jgi:Domain of unknown function (DUF5642)
MLVCALTLMSAACGQPSESVPSPTATAPANLEVNPARIDRVREVLPDGYEVSNYRGPPVPFALWGFRDPPVSDPVQCAVLGAPAVDAATAKGWSASGPGGIVYAVVADAASGPPDPALLAECGRWTAVSGRTTGTVTGIPGPAVDAAETVGMTTTAVTVVEGGTETRSRTETFVAHLGRHLCFVAVVTDPGSPLPALGPGFASDLLAETVSTLRG